MSTQKLEILALEWQVWPLRQQRLKPRAIAVLLLIGLVWLVLLLSLPLVASLVLGMALLVSLLPYYLPTYYRVDADGIMVRRSLGINISSRQRKWSEFVRCEARPNGYLLSPFGSTSQPRPLETWRAVWLPIPTDNTARALLGSLLENFLLLDS